MYVPTYRRPKVEETDQCTHQSSRFQRLGSHTSAVFCRERVQRGEGLLAVEGWAGLSGGRFEVLNVL